MRILHFIDSLDYGGAENLLMSYIPLLVEDEHIVVTLKGPNVFPKFTYEYMQLDVRPVRDVIKAAFKVRKIILQRNIDIVHSHSFWTHIISRLATPPKIKLLNHYHFADYDTMRYKAAVKGMIFLDKLLNRKKLLRIAVSKYSENILIKNFPNSTIKLIPNFFDCHSMIHINTPPPSKQLRIVAVGNCNAEKNYLLVLQAFEELRDEAIYVDIYGGGESLKFFREEVKKRELFNVKFCGSVSEVRKIINKYDLFLSASFSETFGMVVLEAICAKLPLLLSKIPAFLEIAPQSALFFDPYDKSDLANHLKNFLRNPSSINHIDYERIIKKYSSNNFLFKLNKVYND